MRAFESMVAGDGMTPGSESEFEKLTEGCHELAVRKTGDLKIEEPRWRKRTAWSEAQASKGAAPVRPSGLTLFSCHL